MTTYTSYEDAMLVESRDLMNQFLTGYDHPRDPVDTKEKYYIRLVDQMLNVGTQTLFVDFEHIRGFNDKLAAIITKHYVRVEPALSQVVSMVVEQYANDRWDPRSQYRMSIFNHPRVVSFTELRTDKLHTLVTLRGQITRLGQVRPELHRGTFRCSQPHCMSVIRDVRQQFRYTEPSVCSNETCNSTSGFELIPDESVFVDFQRVRVQEMPDEVEAGTTPVSLDVLLRDALVDTVKPGDTVTLVGSSVVVPDLATWKLPGDGVNVVTADEADANRAAGATQSSVTVPGLPGLGIRSLKYRTVFLASHIIREQDIPTLSEGDDQKGALNRFSDKNHPYNYNSAYHGGSRRAPGAVLEGGRGGSIDDKSTSHVVSTLTEDQRLEIQGMIDRPGLIDALVASFAPFVYGNHLVKLGLLCQYVGGVRKVTGTEGIPLRGDVNVLLVGDPSTAKSKILEYVSKLYPRGVYTSGKGSSAAGLTAAVVKDPQSGEFVIEPGAMMLADNGICCVDEFEQISVIDQVAIHEAMEQQSITIAKGGIHATLNA
ncbi:mini-chromosome maintenance protein, partial [Kipferlia bialata]|eukprot:g9764.t1